VGLVNDENGTHTTVLRVGLLGSCTATYSGLLCFRLLVTALLQVAAGGDDLHM
jgi:hypothetical protein